jgi:hypothetical protein
MIWILEKLRKKQKKISPPLSPIKKPRVEITDGGVRQTKDAIAGVFCFVTEESDTLER